MTLLEQHMSIINSEKVNNIIIVETLKLLIGQGYTLREIVSHSDIYNIYTFIDAILQTDPNNQMLLNAIITYYQDTRVDSNKCLVVSDTHIGRLTGDEFNSNNKKLKYDNEKVLDVAYNYALRNNIRTVLHLGDLIEGNSNPFMIRMSLSSQQQYIERAYPKVEEIKTYLIYGNHDYNALRYDHSEKLDPKFYRKCGNMELIGLRTAYVNFDNQMIRLHHGYKNADNKEIYIQPKLILAGHSHNYEVDQLSMTINAPCMTFIGVASGKYGFLELTSEEDCFIIRFLDQNANLKQENRLLKQLHM